MYYLGIECAMLTHWRCLTHCGHTACYQHGIHTLQATPFFFSLEFSNSPPASCRVPYRRVRVKVYHSYNLRTLRTLFSHPSAGVRDHLLEQFPGAADQGEGRRREQSRCFRGSFGRGQRVAGPRSASDLLVRCAAVGGRLPRGRKLLRHSQDYVDSRARHRQARPARTG